MNDTRNQIYDIMCDTVQPARGHGRF